MTARYDDWAYHHGRNPFYGVTNFKSPHTVEISGWAFIKGHDSVDSEIDMVWKSVDRACILTTEIVIEEDVTQHFKELDLNVDSGFMS